MKKRTIKRVLSSYLAGCMLFSTAFSQVIMAEPPAEKTYTVTLDANGGYFSAWNQEEDFLSAVMDSGSRDTDVASGSNYRERPTASDSNANESVQTASGSNTPKKSRLESTDRNNPQKETQIKIEVPKGTSIEQAIDDIQYDIQTDSEISILCGWTTVKNDIMANVYNDSIYGGIGIDTPIEKIDSDITVYALWMQIIGEYKNPNEAEWGYHIRTSVAGEDTQSITQAVKITRPEITEDDLKNKWLSLDAAYDIKNVDYGRAFQVELAGISEKKGIFINVEGDKERPVCLFEMSSDGKKVIREIPIIQTMYGDDTGADGTNLAFTAAHSGKYLVVPMTKLVKIRVENVPGGYIYAEYEEYYENTGKWMTKVIPIGEEVGVPVETELMLRAEPYSDFYLMGLTGTDEDEFFDLPLVELNRLIVKNDDGEKDIAAGEDDSFFRIKVKKDTVITGEFVAEEPDDSEPDDGDTPQRRKLRIGMTNTYYPEPGKVETEVFVYEGSKDNRVEVENLEIERLNQHGNSDDLFELEGNRLRSLDALPYGNYGLYFEFDYNGVHCSMREGKDLWLTLHGNIQIGSGVSFGAYLAEGRFKGKDYCISESVITDQLIFTSPETKYSALQPHDIGDMGPEAELVNYSFEGWYDLDGNAVPADKKVGGGFDLKAKFVNGKGEPYRVVVLPLTGDGDNPGGDEEPGGNGSGGSGGNGSGSSGGGGSHSSAGNPSSGSAGVMTGQWQKDSDSWKFLKSNGTYAVNEWGQINGKWYYFGADTNMQTSWLFWNNSWYYLDPLEGSMRTGWVLEPETGDWYYMEDSGIMSTGWQKLGEKWYYMNPDSDGTKGKMVKDCWIDGYYIDSNGEWAEGTIK